MNSKQTNRPLRLGTRGSPLARWQAEFVAAELKTNDQPVDLVVITTSGDVTDRSLTEVGGTGLFTKEIQRALLDRRIDLAVHSLKDLPTEPVPGLVLASVPSRENPFDVLVTKAAGSFDQLPRSSRVGTGSRRRQSQLLYVRPDLQLTEIRGNVETRLRKLDEGQYDAIVLAYAGLHRLGLTERITQVLPESVMVPAIGQGALGIETRGDDVRTIEAVKLLNHVPTHCSVLAEREVLRQLRAGCLAPVGAIATLERDTLRLTAVVLSPDGRQRIGVTMTGESAKPEDLGRRVAQDLLAQGAGDLIATSRKP